MAQDTFLQYTLPASGNIDAGHASHTSSASSADMALSFDSSKFTSYTAFKKVLDQLLQAVRGNKKFSV
jgi:hypothetical protein